MQAPAIQQQNLVITLEQPPPPIRARRQLDAVRRPEQPRLRIGEPNTLAHFLAKRQD